MKQIAEYGPLVIFFAAFFMSGKDIYFATAALMFSYSLGMLMLWKLEGHLSKTHQIMWLVIMIFGGLTLFLKNEMFIKWKPTIANWLFAIVFLGSHYLAKQPLIQTMLGNSIKLKKTDWKTLSWMWIAFFIICGLLNIYVAYHYSTEFWVKFKVFGLIGLILLFSVFQGIWLMQHGEFSDEQNTTDTEHLSMPTSRIEKIKHCLNERFPNAQITLDDESHLHAGHAGAQDGRGHFRLHILTDEFKDLTRIQRHQLIYETLGELMQSDIHALTINAKVADEIF